MSSILEALKKLEDEKAARRGGMGNLAGKVAKTGRRPRQAPAWLVPGGMLAVAVVSVLITYFAVTGISSRRSESAPAKKPPGVSLAPDTLLPPAGTPVTDELKPRQPYPPPGEKVGKRSHGASRRHGQKDSHPPEGPRKAGGSDLLSSGEQRAGKRGVARPDDERDGNRLAEGQRLPDGGREWQSGKGRGHGRGDHGQGNTPRPGTFFFQWQGIRGIHGEIAGADVSGWPGNDHETVQERRKILGSPL